MQKHADFKVSIVLPAYNESKVLPVLTQKIVEALKNTDYEIVFSDDASTDTSRDILEKLAREYPVKAVYSDKQQGQYLCTIKGILHADGDIVVTMDADLQDPPEIVPDLVKKIIEDNVDVVFAVKRKRDDIWWMKVGADIYSWVTKILGQTYIPVGAGSMLAMKREIAQKVSKIKVKWANISIVARSVSKNWSTVMYDKYRRYDEKSRVGFTGLIAEALGSWLLSGVLHRLMFICGCIGILISIIMNPIAIVLPVSCIISGIALAYYRRSLLGELINEQTG